MQRIKENYLINLPRSAFYENSPELFIFVFV